MIYWVWIAYFDESKGEYLCQVNPPNPSFTFLVAYGLSKRAANRTVANLSTFVSSVQDMDSLPCGSTGWMVGSSPINSFPWI